MPSDYDPDAISIVNGAVIAALLDILIVKGAIEPSDARTILSNAKMDIGKRTRSDLRNRATQLVTEILNRYPD